MSVDTDVERLSDCREPAMAVPEQMPGIIVAFIPYSEAVMAKDDRISFDDNIHQIGPMEKAAGEFLFRFLIVSAPDQDNIAIQPAKDNVPITPSKIPQMINEVSLSPEFQRYASFLCFIGFFYARGEIRPGS